MSDKYDAILTPTVRRQLAESLPEAVTAAAWEFIDGPLRENPHRVGRRLQQPKAHLFSARRGTYRVLYRIDDDTRCVSIVSITHRRDAYR